MTPHPDALPRTARPLWLLLVLSLLTWLAACSDSPPPAPTISVQPSDTAAVAGSAATLSVTADGADIAFQWQQSSDGGTTWTDLAGATSARYTTPTLAAGDNGRRYRVVVSSSGISLTSSAVTLTVTAAVVSPAVTVAPAAQSVTAPANAVFSVTVTGTAPTYQWQRSIDNGATWSAIGGAAGASYDAGATDVSMSGHEFRVVVSNSAGSVTSAAATLTVAAPVAAAAFTSQPTDIAVTAGQNAQFMVAVSGTPTPTLQWQMRTNPNVIWGDLNINGVAQTGTTLNIGATTLAQNGFQFRVLATNSAGVATSSIATLTVNVATAAPLITTQPTPQSVTAPATATFTAAASGVPTPTWQWQMSVSGGAFANINGATAASYTTPATTVGDSGKQYRAVASNGSGSVNSNPATLTVTGAVGRAWQTAALIETNNVGDGSRAQIAVDTAGNALAVWQQWDGSADSIWANRYTAATNTWGTAALIETDNAGDASAPQVAIDGSGNAVAVWRQDDGTSRYNIWANLYTAATNTWGTATLLETNAATAPSGPQVAMDASGNALAVWNHYAGTGSSVWANRYTAGTGWGTAARIETGSTNSAGPPQIAINASGNAIAVWNRFDGGSRNDIWANRYSAATNTWGTAALIETGNAGTAEAPEIAIDGNGNGVATWAYFDGARYDIMATHYSAATSAWGPAAVSLTAGAGSGGSAQVVFDAAGNATAVWSQEDGTRYNIWASRYTAGVGWGPAAVIESDDAGNASDPQIAFDSNGNAFAVWYQTDGTRYNIWANRYTAGTGWGTAVLLETDNAGHASRPQVAIDGSGNAIVVWDQSDGSRINIWARTYR